MLGVKRTSIQSKCRVELHHHLDSAIRIDTAWNLMRSKGHPLPGDGSPRDLKDLISVSQSGDLGKYLRGRGYYFPAIVNDLEALERIAYEAVEDLCLARVVYCETRFSPFMLVHRKGEPVVGFLEDTKHLIDVSNPPSGEEALNAILRGLERGRVDFGTKVRVLLMCVRGRPEWSWDTLRLCELYRSRGVIGIDVAGDESILSNKLDAAVDKDAALADDVDVQVFQEAKKKGIHRTVHTAESAPGRMALVALDHFCAERLGHGYRACLDEEVYAECLRRQVHFEVCPTSALLTGALPPDVSHPIFRMVEDGASWSYSSDDPILTSTGMEDEAKFLQRLGLDESNLASAAFQGALHSFLPDEEKQDLLKHLRKTYGMV